MEKRVFVLYLLFSYFLLEADNAVSPTYVPRSQGRDKMRTLVGTIGRGYTDIYDAKDWYGNLSLAILYSQSFRQQTISECLFGCDISCDTVLVEGSEVANRNENAWLADYFYLNCNYKGSFQFEPRIQNVLVDLDFYLGLDPLLGGMYLRMYGPITWTKWSTSFCVSDQAGTSTAACRVGYFTSTGTESLLTSLGDYFCGEAPAQTEGITFSPLCFAKMPNCDNTKAGFAELRIELGWNIVQKEDSHIGFNIQAAAPTGGKRRAEFVFDPVVGNGDHWEIGAGVTAHYIFRDYDSSNYIAGWFTDLSITHVLRSIEERTFDLCGKPNSRYMLAAKFSDNIQNNLSGSNIPDTSAATLLDVTNPIGQFANEYNPVANLTTIGIKVKNTIQVDWVTMFHIGWGNMSVDLGYDFWIRTCENILNSRGGNNFCSLCAKPNLFDQSQDDTWALKGDAQMFGYATSASGGLTVDQPIALSATESNATIHKGTNKDATGTNPEQRNLGIDNPRFAYGGTNNQQLNYATGLAVSENNHIKTSLNPIFINFDNINFQPVRGISHKLFGYYSYHWKRKRYMPYLGLGMFVEIGQNKSRTIPEPTEEVAFIDTCCAKCMTCSLSQWAIWLKGGFAFE